MMTDPVVTENRVGWWSHKTPHWEYPATLTKSISPQYGTVVSKPKQSLMVIKLSICHVFSESNLTIFSKNSKKGVNANIPAFQA